MPEDDFDLPPVGDTDVAKIGTKDYAIIEWCEAKLKRGANFIESQVGYDKIDMACKEIFSYEKQTTASYVPGGKTLSQTRIN